MLNISYIYSLLYYILKKNQSCILYMLNIFIFLIVCFFCSVFFDWWLFSLQISKREAIIIPTPIHDDWHLPAVKQLIGCAFLLQEYFFSIFISVYKILQEKNLVNFFKSLTFFCF